MEDAEATPVPSSAQSEWSAPANPDEYDVTVKAEQLLLAHIAQRRDDADRHYAQLEEVIGPRIDAHLSAADAAVRALDEIQRYISDRTDLALDVDSRQLAVLLLIGRLAGLAAAMVALLRQGFCAETVPTIRVMHETSRLLHGISDRAEPDFLRRWLEDDDGDWVRPWEMRELTDRIRQRSAASLEDMKADAEAQGLDDLAAGFAEALEDVTQREDEETLSNRSRTIYDVLSRIGHSRRSGIRDSVALPLRRFSVGPHPDPRIRADYVLYGVMILEEALLSVSDGITSAYWPGFHVLGIMPMIAALEAVRGAHPLDEI